MDRQQGERRQEYAKREQEEKAPSRWQAWDGKRRGEGGGREREMRDAGRNG